MPVCMNSLGYSRAAGLMGVPLMSSVSSAIMRGPPSITSPMPENTRPSMSGLTPSEMPWPENETVLCARFMPALLSKS